MSRNGVRCEIREILEGQRKEDVNSAVAGGNHKPSSAQLELLEELLKDDIIDGFQLQMQIETACNIRNGVVSPYGIAD